MLDLTNLTKTKLTICQRTSSEPKENPQEKVRYNVPTFIALHCMLSSSIITMLENLSKKMKLFSLKHSTQM